MTISSAGNGEDDDERGHGAEGWDDEWERSGTHGMEDVRTGEEGVTAGEESRGEERYGG